MHAAAAHSRIGPSCAWVTRFANNQPPTKMRGPRLTPRTPEDFSQPMSTQTTALSPAGKTTEPTTNAADSFASLFEASISAGDFGKEGEIVKGTVVAVQRDNVIIDIGGKSEGIIALAEFSDAQGQATVKPGDEVDVYIESRERRRARHAFQR